MSMAAQNFLILNLLRVITPEEIGDIATKHNGGKFLSLTDLVNERVEHKIYRDFSGADAMDEIHEAHNQVSQAQILPFKKANDEDELRPAEESESELQMPAKSIEEFQAQQIPVEEKPVEADHKENENMSSFILIEKARLKRSQQILKQKEIIDLYQKNSHVDVEAIKGSNTNLEEAREAGVLINKKQY